jgi:dTDP-4-amino-4,6-dideoxygalactose transaminase
VDGLSPAYVADGAEHAYYIYPIKYASTVTGIPRQLFVRAINAELPVAESAEQVGLAAAYVRPLYLAPLYQKKIALGSKGFPWNMNPEVNYDYSKGLCPVVERMHEQEMLMTMLIREPLTEADIDDFVSSIKKVLRHKEELAGLA